MNATKSQIRDICENFLQDWNRSDWMVENGEWDENDEIEEGTIDPDGVESECEDLEIGDSWQGWDCREGWGAHKVGDALYLNWWRSPYPNTVRHERDLWVEIDGSYFEESE